MVRPQHVASDMLARLKVAYRLLRRRRRIPTFNPWHPWLWTTFAPLLAVVTVFVTTVFDPFGFESATKHHSANLFYKLYAAHYPAKMREKIVVVLLDDDTLKRLKETWPPTHRAHANILDAIREYEPKAVLIDLFFVHPRDNDYFENTVAAIAGLHAKSIPVFMIAASADTRATQPTRFEIRQMAASRQVTLVSPDINREAEPTPYPLHRDSSEHWPAAVALYDALCPTIPDKKKCAHLIPSGEPTTHDETEMDVVWGLAPAPYNCLRAGGTYCGSLNTSVIGRALQLAWEGFYPREARHTDPVRVPYHTTISTLSLVANPNVAELTKLLKDKIVIYGADIALERDTVASPVHGKIPGAYIHAMALDNLLTFDEHSIRRHKDQTFSPGLSGLLPTIVMVITAILVSINRRRLLRRYALDHVHELREADEHFVHWMGRILLGVVLVVGAVQFVRYGISPINWLGLLIVVHVAHRIERWFFRPEAWRAKFERNYKDMEALGRARRRHGV